MKRGKKKYQERVNQDKESQKEIKEYTMIPTDKRFYREV